jgi:hypothetical protein
MGFKCFEWWNKIICLILNMLFRICFPHFELKGWYKKSKLLLIIGCHESDEQLIYHFLRCWRIFLYFLKKHGLDENLDLSTTFWMLIHDILPYVWVMILMGLGSHEDLDNFLVWGLFISRVIKKNINNLL